MKNTIKKMSALLMALVMCLSCMTTVLAHDYDENDLVHQYAGYATDAFDISATAQEQADGSYTVTYTAKLTMSEQMAYVVYNYKEKTTDPTLEDLEFVCKLNDTLIAQLEPSDNVTFNLVSDIFIPIDNNAVVIGTDDITATYKLDPTVVDSWDLLGAEDVVNELTKQISITASKTVTAAQMSAATGITNADSIKATVVLTGLAAPQLLAEDTGKLTINAYRAPSTGGSSNGSINVKDSENGEISVNTTWANPGQTITVTAQPDAGYEVEEITVIDANGKEIAVTKIGDNKYTFKMPATKATVSAKFVKDGTASDDEPVVIPVASPEETGVAAILNTDEHFAYMNGDNNGSFRPNAGITRAEVCQMFFNLLTDKSEADSAGFADVADSAWYAQAVNKMAALGIVNGKGNNKFEPNVAITRAEFAAIVVRFARENDHKASFSDVSASHWAYSYISTAAGYGWIGGVGNNKFEPERNITRAEAATLANRILGRSADKAAIDAGAARAWPDVSKAHWAYYDIAEATTAHEYTVDETSGEETWA